MSKKEKNVIVGLFIVMFLVGLVSSIFIGYNVIQNADSKLNVSSVEDLTTLVDKIYKGVTMQMPNVATQEIDITDADMVQYVTGLENGNDLEYAVVSEPMMSSQPYSLVLVKVKNGVNADNVAKTMKKNINIRKWICVSAEKVYATTSGDVVCLVMSNADTAKAVYDSFKTLAGSVGQEYERSEEEPELPPEMF